MNDETKTNENENKNANGATPVLGATVQPGHQPLRSEDVQAATLPLHVGVDRVAAAREKAAPAHRDNENEGKQPAEGETNDTAEGQSGAGTAEGAGEIHPTAKVPEPGLANAVLVLDLFPDELRAHIAAINERGLVQLAGLPDTIDVQARNTWFAIAEVADYVDNPAKTFIAANAQPTTAAWGPCRELVEGKAIGHQITGTLGVPATTVEILGQSFNCATVAGVIGYVKAPHGG